jgi:hypothetical protein
MTELEHGFMPSDSVEIHRIEKSAVQIEDSGFRQLKVLLGRILVFQSKPATRFRVTGRTGGRFGVHFKDENQVSTSFLA